MSKATSNTRPKRPRKDTAKIAPFRAEVKKQKVQRASRKRSKAQREDYGLDLEEQEEIDTKEKEESDLPDVDEIGRSTTGQQTRRELLIRDLRAHGDFDVSEMDDSELDRVWTDVKQAKKAKKRQLFGKTSKVVDNAPARPAISPKRKRGRSPSPQSTSNKRSRNDAETRKRPKPKVKGQSKGVQSQTQLKSSTKSSKPRSSVSHAGSRSSSRAPSTLAGSRGVSSARSGDFGQSMDVDSDDDSEDEDEDNEGESESESESESEDESEEESSKSRRPPTTGSKKKAKSGDFTGTEHVILDETVLMVECHLLLVDYFLPPQDLLIVTKEKWETAVRNRKEKLKNFPMDKRNFQAIKARIQSFRGRLRKTCSDAGTGLLNAYGLEGLSQGSAEAIEVIDSLLPHGVHLKPGSKPGYGFFQHDFILEAIYQIIFTGRHPLAHAHPELFRTFPPRLVTLTTSIIHGVLDKYKLEPHSGNKNKDDQLLLPDVLSYYKVHRKTMRLFESQQEDRFDIVLSLLRKRCFERAGVRQSALVKPKKFEPLTASHFARDEPTEEERVSLGLLPKATKITTSGPSQSHSHPSTSSADQQSKLNLKATLDNDNEDNMEEPRDPTPDRLRPSLATNITERPRPKARPKPPSYNGDVQDEHDSTHPPSVSPAPPKSALIPSTASAEALIPATPAGKTTAPITSPVPAPAAPRSGPTGEHTPPSPKFATGSTTKSPVKSLAFEPPATPSTVKSTSTSAKPVTVSTKSMSVSASPLRRKGLVVELSTKPAKKGPASLRNAGGHVKARK